MLKYVIKRIILMLVSLFIIMTMLFVLVRLLPNPITAVPGGFDKALRDMREAWGYNKPIMVQYGIFLRNVFTKWDWGFCTSMGTFLQPVTHYLASKLPATIYVNVFSVLLSLPVGITFGIVAAVNSSILLATSWAGVRLFLRAAMIILPGQCSTAQFFLCFRFPLGRLQET